MASNKYWACFLLLFGKCASYENLCRKTDIIASQSSDRVGLPATKAVDGNYNQRSYLQCSHTAPGRTKAWFQVDLRRPYRVNSVTIYYRNEDNWKPYRFRQFYLDVSNTSAAVSTTSTPQRMRCYKDNTTYPTTHPAVIDITCKQTAQYVIIETTYNAPENPPLEHGPMLEICEIDIFGCSTDCFGDTCYSNGVCDRCGGGHWGQTCKYNCPSNCYMGSCDKYSGSCNRGCRPGFWGVNCTERCSVPCLNEICDYDNGTCVEGCKTYFTGSMCQSCIPTRYGEKCEEPCSINCINETCQANNGTCTFGCDGNHVGAKCLQYLTVLKDKYSFLSSKHIMYIGSAGGGAVLLCLAVIVLVIYVRARRPKHPYSTSKVVYKRNNYDQMTSSIAINVEDREDPEEEPQIENPEEAVYCNDLTVAKDIDVSDLLKVITQKGAKEDEGFLKEFKSLPYGERFNCLTAKLEENMLKNRFKTTFPYDHTRVVLEVGDGFTSDYINANYIENIDGKHEYIACQAPRENTLVDHWRMIWQERVEYIVMLTKLIEGPKVKSCQYWPEEDEELDIGSFHVKLLDQKVYAYFTMRRINVQREGVNGSRTVVQFHYTEWPDHGTPDPIDLLTFLRHFRHQIEPSPHPIIVHCSAGIGRTGTFLALDVLSRYGKVKGRINVVEFVKAMRRNRMTMVQNSEQYIFLYHALYEFFRRQGQFIAKDTFLKMYGELDKPETKKDLANEFNALTCLQPRYEAKDFKTGQNHPKQNRTESVLPVERYLVHLTSSVKGRGTYYNAVFVSSFTQAQEFISAQYPVPGSAIDLVRLLVDHESAFLVCLNSLTVIEELKEWAEEGTKIVQFGPYKIAKVLQTTLSNAIRKTRAEIQIKNTKEKHTVHIFECLDWSLNELFPAGTSSLTDMLKQISLDRKSIDDGHITVLSKDGASCCGLFIAVYNAVQQLQLDGEIDMFTIVQQLHCRRPEMISTKEEYEFCFKSVCNYLSTDCLHANT